MPADNEPALELRGVCKRFGAVQALRGVSLVVPPGSIVALVGENGAGKSTLSGVAAGLLRPDAGEVRIGGKALSFHTPADGERAGVRIVPQEMLLCPNLTVAENVCLGHMPTSRRGVLDVREMRQLASARLARLGIEIDVAARVEQLSVVNRAFVQIARAMTPGARVVIVDEPTAPMSSTEVERVLATLESIAASGVAMVYVSHRLDEVFRLAHRVVVLRDGCVAGEFPIGELTNDRLVRSMIGDRDLEVARPQAVQRGDVVLSAREVRGVTVHGVSLDIRAGEIVAVYGIAGSGREALAGLLCGAAARRAGEVTIAGKPVQGGNVRAAVRAGLGFVPAERRSQGLVQHASIRDNLTIASLDRVTRRGLLSAARECSVVDAWCQRLRITASSSAAPVSTLSGGNQQKVLVARWLAAGSKTLVLEEPTRGVDIGSKAEIYRLLRELADDGAGVLITTSDIEEVTLVGDRILVMRAGRIVRALDAGATRHEVLTAALAPDVPDEAAA